METVRIHYLAALIVPTAYAIACGGSDNPPANTGGGTGASSTSAGGSSSGNGGSTTSNGGSSGTTTTGSGGFMIPPPETIHPDPKCPSYSVPVPDGGFMGGGMFPVPDGGFNFPGCCDQTGVCGFAFSFMSFSQCITAADAQRFGMGMGGGFDAGPPIPCTYTP